MKINMHIYKVNSVKIYMIYWFSTVKCLYITTSCPVLIWYIFFNVIPSFCVAECSTQVTATRKWVPFCPARVSFPPSAERGSKECTWKSNQRNKSCSLLSGFRAEVTESLNKGQGITDWFGCCLAMVIRLAQTLTSLSLCTVSNMTGNIPKLKITLKIKCIFHFGI